MKKYEPEDREHEKERERETYREREKREARNEFLKYIFFWLFMLYLWIALWIVQSYNEAVIFNRVTGKNMTTYDAMFVQLRITN